MLKSQFTVLLNGIQENIQREDTSCRDAIPAKIKLQACLYFLVTGATYRCISQFFLLGVSTISKFIPEVLDAIHDFLKPYIKVPSTEQEWNSIENGFKTRWNFPGCYGSIDGKHFAIQAPPCSGSTYYNYKGFHSLVLLAIVDHDYCFRYINIGASGRNSDGGSFRVSQMLFNSK
uniref:DDE Tnp4 domain-containing protein n=1 Tax=Anopheles atroparvus TaxID=41427 RepID=A0AAG5DRV9_ANOAO